MIGMVLRHASATVDTGDDERWLSADEQVRFAHLSASCASGVGGAGESASKTAPALRAALGERVRFGHRLARYTSLRVGGPADAMVRAESVEDIQATLAIADAGGLPVFILGGGTNVLVSDAGVRGLVLLLGRSFDYVHWTEDDRGATVTVGASARVGRVVRRLVAAALGGLESAEGIPGTIGGGLLMNAGAYGSEMSRVVAGVSGVTAEGSHIYLSREALRFRYRHASLPSRFIVTEVVLRLQRESASVLRSRMLVARRRRESSQPKGYPSAGSMFKNPPGDYAARLIEAAGLKGVRLGNIRISERHANFFVNLGGGYAAEVKALLDLAQRVVWERFQHWLEPEVRLVGQW